MVKSKHSTCRVGSTGSDFFFGLTGIFPHASLRGIGSPGKLVLRSRRHGNRSQNDRGGMAVDRVARRLLSNRWLAILLELTQNLLPNKRAQQRRPAQYVRTCVVDRRRNKKRQCRQYSLNLRESRVRALGRRVSARFGSQARGVRNKTARIEVSDVQRRIVKLFGTLGLG